MKQSSTQTKVENSSKCSGSVSTWYKLLNKLEKNLFLIFLITIIIIFYYIYMFWNIVPLIQSSQSGLNYRIWESEHLHDSNYCLGFFYLIFFHYNFFWFVYCLAMIMFTDPGEVHLDYRKVYSLLPLDKFSTDRETLDLNIEKHINLMNFRQNTKSKFNKFLPPTQKLQLKSSFTVEQDSRIIDDSCIDESILEVKATDQSAIAVNSTNLFKDVKWTQIKGRQMVRTCRYCLIIKSDRMHHCRSCRKCVLKSDHHCYFINNCIGYKNYRYFLCFLFYSFILLLFISVTMVSGLKYFYFEYGIDSLEFMIFSITYSLAIITLVSITYFFGLHLFLAAKNLTTIEYLEKYKKNSKLISKHPFDLGPWSNLKLLLGSNVFFWFFPVRSSGSLLDGYQFESKHEKQLN